MAFTAEDVLALARAGYNSQQIALLSRASEQPAAPAAPAALAEEQAPALAPAPAPAPAPSPAPAPAAAPAAPAPAPAPSPAPAAYQDIMEQLQQLTGAIQMNNQINSQQPKPETVEDILAAVIEP